MVVEGGATQRPGLVGTVELQDGASGSVFELCRAVIRHHLAAGEQHPQTRQVELGEFRCVQQHHELRRHRGEHAHTFALDERKRGNGVEAREHRGRCAEQGWGDVTSPDPETERRRKQAHEHVIATEVRGRDREVVEGVPPLLIVHHAFRKARRARCGVEQPERVGCTPKSGSFGATHAINAGVGRHEDEPEAGGELGAVRFGDQSLRAGAVEQMLDLAVAGAGTDPHDHKPRAFDREEGNVHRRTVGQQHAHAIAVGEPERSQCHGERVRPLVVLAPGHALTGRDVGQPVGLRRRVAGDRGRQRRSRCRHRVLLSRAAR